MGGAETSLAECIVSALRGSDDGKSMELKSLRSRSLKSSQMDVDKSSKKQFKSAVKQLEADERISLSADGIVKLSKSERSKDKSSKKKSKKRKRESKGKIEGATRESKKSKDVEDEIKIGSNAEVGSEAIEHDDDENDDGAEEPVENEEDHQSEQDGDGESEPSPADKNKPCRNNPQGITRLFVGNLPFAVTEETLNAHMKGCVTHIKWITDKETGKFYGSSFVEVRNSKDAAICVKEINQTQLMGRPIKINYAPMRAGEEKDWPPRSKVITGGKVANSGGQAGGSGIKALKAKPDGCCKLFLGNLSYEIDDDGITKFFAGVDAELKAVRWLFHQDSGDFKGCGFADFWNTEACEKAASLNGKTLLGRPIRIDWAE
ncbi:hypothetical protein THAOC_21281 [Thalassiosira oceanica]|uniref:RRM domain-containing protein n=1 Tax=Thalassiosira oceanica TaxID=159749 RepID=K0RZV9_THAOC|nr:hypothetical protein THAOC_21281 [Thalassiosira oceanica]|mmetsp:Transcript_11723/g.27538  ORF Transcript_11723/g.27538 Transcript_11723/m.27538 type:complete len:376 (+) Transcript_11723:126-1253(+)|eukprot:EJK58580.1 hypothetical protein THAOC_21281 [Thalassiosira oceanica]